MAGSAELSSKSSGGCTFDDLCKGLKRSYACDHAIELTHSASLNDTNSVLEKHVKECIQSIETKQGRGVERFYIGKTYVHGRKNTTFDHTNPNTWRKDGISKRFRAHKDNGYGRDGLVVLAVITKEMVPTSVRNNKDKVRQELYALALESRLIQHFLIEEDDLRIVNNTVSTGASNGNRSVGYALYMAYELESWEDKWKADWKADCKAGLIPWRALFPADGDQDAGWKEWAGLWRWVWNAARRAGRDPLVFILDAWEAGLNCWEAGRKACLLAKVRFSHGQYVFY